MIDEYLKGALLLADPTIREQHEQVKGLIKKAKRLIFVGNGGSFQGHMAHDFLKVGKKPTLTPESASLLTCLFNDYGKADAYKEWFEVQYQEGDLLILVSSSGQSENIITLAQYANRINCPIVTITGFSTHNRVTQMGTINVHLNTSSFGIHECFGQIFLHSVLDDLVKGI